MSMGPASSPQFLPGHGPQATLRVSDAEREQVVALLQQAYTEGRLDNTELDERIDSAFEAKTRGELSGVLRGLPVGQAWGSTATPAQGPRPVGATSVPSALERSWSMAAHGLGIFTFCLGPALIATTKGRTSDYIRQQAWEAANFQLTALGAYIALGMVTAITLGIAGVFFPILGMAWLVLSCVGTLASASGNPFCYPWTLRLLGK